MSTLSGLASPHLGEYQTFQTQIKPLAAAKLLISSQGTHCMMMIMRLQTQNIVDIAQLKTVDKLFQLDSRSIEQISMDYYKIIDLV